MMRMLPIFATIDTDRDGALSSDEIENATKSLGKLDKNKDGKLDMSELRPDFDRRPGPPPREGDRGPREGERGPREGDRGPREGERGPREGERGPREGERGPREGERGPREGERGPREGERGPRERGGDASMLDRLLQLDQDDDGELSKDELAKLPERGRRLLESADQDDDGALSKDELKKMRERGEQMRRRRGQSDQ